MKRYWYKVLLVLLSLTSVAQAQQWSAKAPLPGSARDGVVSFAIGDKVYMGGGSKQKDFYAYDPATGKWSKMANIPGVTTERAFGISFSINRKGYVGLGSDGNKFLNDLWEYDPAANTWTRKADFPGSGRAGAGSFVIDKMGYVGGGVDNSLLYSEFYQYDPAKDAWGQLDPIPVMGLVFPATFSLNGYGYIGTGASGSSELETNEMFQYEPNEGIWRDVAPFPGTPRQAATGFALDGKGYVGFGQAMYDTVFGDFYSYDPIKDTWTSAPNNNASPRAWAAAVTTPSSVFIGTGWDFSASAQKDIWVISNSAARVAHSIGHLLDIVPVPNPVAKSLHLKTDFDLTNATVSVVNSIGQIVSNEQLHDASLDVSALAAGAYTVQVTAGEHRAECRFVKQ